MPYDTPYNRRIVAENNDIVKKYLEHIQKNMMFPYLDYDSGYMGGMAPRAPITEDSYEEIEIPLKKKRQPVKVVEEEIEEEEPEEEEEYKEEDEDMGLKDVFGNGRKKKKVYKYKKPKVEKKPKATKKGGKSISSIVDVPGPSFLTPQEKLDKIVKSGGKRGRPKKTEAVVEKKSSNIEDIIKAVEGKGMAELHIKPEKEVGKGMAELCIKPKNVVGKGKTGRVVGGRKLLLKEQQPPSQMSGNAKPKKENKWLTYLAEFRKKHPELKGKELVKKAKVDYQK